MTLLYEAISTEIATHYWQDGLDDDGNKIEVSISDGSGVPCRHCLQDVATGEPFLILAHRPFPSKGAYSEMGPIFIHQKPCERYAESSKLPGMFKKRDAFLMRGYNHRHRIVYGSGRLVATGEIHQQAQALFENTDVAYIHLRSGKYNCFQCQMNRAVNPDRP